LVDVSSKPAHSRAATKKSGRKSAAMEGRAFILHPEAATRSQFNSVLRSLGLAPVEFETAEQLFDRLLHDHPEIILWGMPGCTTERLEEFRKTLCGRMLPIVLVTSMGDGISEEQAYDAGACDLLVLPLPCHRVAPALSLALLRFEALETLHDEHESEENLRAARGLVWRAAKVWARRRGITENEALRHVLNRSYSKGHTLTRASMEVVAEGLFP
jgi:AmiR/NasT family two-component response regulator